MSFEIYTVSVGVICFPLLRMMRKTHVIILRTDFIEYVNYKIFLIPIRSGLGVQIFTAILHIIFKKIVRNQHENDAC